ncbi:MAG: lysophospholipid acyltransferase family protein [Elusimicrobiota bacterium]
MPGWLSLILRAALTAAGFAASLLPRRVELWLGPRLGRLVLRLGLFRSDIVRGNIRHCLPELGATGQADLLRKNYEHYGILLFEFLHFFSPIPGHFKRYAEINSSLEGYENWKKAHDKGKGVIFFSCHLGFWEMLAAASGLAGMAPTVVTTVLKPRWLHDKITSCRASVGIAAAYHPGSLPSIMKALKKGGSVAFMNDQYAAPPMGVPALFFGVRPYTLAAVGPLARRLGAAVVPVWGRRDENGVTRVIIEPEIDLEPARDDAQAATEILAARVEKWIRQCPEQWLWLHRRFKNVDWQD